MSPHLLTWRHLARVTIEFTTPFRVGSGADTVLADLVPVADANGLPALPGTSIAGVLSHAYRSRAEEDRTWRGLFGEGGDGARGSRLWVTWGHLHDSNDRPVEGLRLQALDDDPVLADALSPTVRDHVRIGHRGGPAHHGKFDDAVVSAGHRFTFDLTVEGDAGGRDELAGLLDLLASGALRFGASTRRGMGAFRVVRARWGAFDLGNPTAARAFSSLPVRLDQPAAALQAYPVGSRQEEPGVLRISLEPEAHWAVHGADPWCLPGEEKAPDLNPVRDSRIEWQGNQGRVVRDGCYLPGSSVKGALAHRTAFYANLLAGRFADQVEALDPWVGDANPEVAYLFGRAKNGTGDDQAGRVFIDDVWLDPAYVQRTQRLPHITINRFTGGVLEGFLMEERAFYRTGRLELALRFGALPAALQPGLRERALTALHRALTDLVQGQLPLGAGASRGNGVFLAAPDYDFAAAWQRAVGTLEVGA